MHCTCLEQTRELLEFIFYQSFHFQELVCRVRQLEAHVKQLQNIVIKKDSSSGQPVSAKRKMKPPREIDFNK